MYTHQQFAGKSVKQLRAEKEVIVDQLAKTKMKGSTTAEQLSPNAFASRNFMRQMHQQCCAEMTIIHQSNQMHTSVQEFIT